MAELTWPSEDEGPAPVVMLLHGGFWQASFRRDLMNRLASVASGRGWATWNVEYRRVGRKGSGGGWPATFEDVAAALDYLATVDGIDPDRVGIVGHEAGGQLAIWLASRANLPDGSPGCGETAGSGSGGTPVQPRVVISLAGVTDLPAAFADQIARGALTELLGGSPSEAPQRYAQASPVALVPAACPVVLLHGDADTVVPLSQSKRYLAAARAAGDHQTSLMVLEGLGHHELLDPDGEGWGQAAAALTRALTPPRLAHRPAAG